MCFVYVFALEECARVVAYWRSLLIGPHYRSDKRWHDTPVIRARHFSAMLRSRLMSIVMIVCVEHECACVRDIVVNIIIIIFITYCFSHQFVGHLSLIQTNVSNQRLFHHQFVSP